MSSSSYLKALYEFFKNNEQNELTITIWTPDADRDAKIVAQFHQKPENSFFDTEKEDFLENLEPKGVDKDLEQELLKLFLRDYPDLKFDLKEGNKPIWFDGNMQKIIERISPSQIENYQKLINDEIEKGNSTKGFFISLNIKNPIKYIFYCPKTIEHIKNSPDKDNIQLLLFINSTDYRFEITSENGDTFIADDFDENYSVNESI